jgi:hypothetical protein
MRSIIPRPILLALTLMLVIGAIAAIEIRLDARANTERQPKGDLQKAKGGTDLSDEQKQQAASGSSGNAERSVSQRRDAGEKLEQTVSDAERIANKESEYERARCVLRGLGVERGHRSLPSRRSNGWPAPTIPNGLPERKRL